ncbi:amino acid ABC transporter permease [Telmatospirillum sp.]|uniref:amino acid ABC transporter permease n=1 Tax=Telmatospirillum sp. TaxID=2079197 RepID=UPI0028502400|nr:amino acid ABC transporter permease [Telmatospirillum sp.]MDR3436962.1 amino acid ABC transporter permease [Telmatospirillum sp.]
MNRVFSLNDLTYILLATRWTVLLSLIAFAGGAFLGLIVALGRVSERRSFRFACATYIRLFQNTPLLMQLFLVYFGVNIVGLNIDPLAAAAAGLILNAAAFLGEIWRGCIQAIPPGQDEAGRAIGLSSWHRMWLIVLPQALRIAIAPTVGFLVQIIKNTSLASIIGFTELTRSGQITNNATFRPFLIFGIVALLYFVQCWPLSYWSRKLELRLGTDGKGT